MKQFRIVQETSTVGNLRYYVQHRVRLLGLSLWWSSIWFYSDGSADYECCHATEERAREQLDALRLDWRVKQQHWVRKVIDQ